MPFRSVPTYRNLCSAPLLAPVTSNTFTTTDLYVGTVAPLQPPIVVPANYCQNGTAFKLTAFGTYTTATTPNFNFSVTFGSATVATGLVHTLTAVGPLQWKWETWHQIKVTGLAAAATMESWGTELWTPTSLTTAPVVANVPQIAEATVAIDTTVASTFTLKGTYSASAAGNIIVLRGFWLEEISVQ